MIHYETAASDLPLSTTSVTERVFEGLTPRLDDVVVIDGVDGQSPRIEARTRHRFCRSLNFTVVWGSPAAVLRMV